MFGIKNTSRRPWKIFFSIKEIFYSFRHEHIVRLVRALVISRKFSLRQSNAVKGLTLKLFLKDDFIHRYDENETVLGFQ